MLLESVFDVFLLCVKFPPCRAFFMMHLVRLGCQTCFFRFLMPFQKQRRAYLGPQINSELKGGGGGGREGEKLLLREKNAARAPNAGAASSSSRSLKFTVLFSFTHQLLFDPHQPHPVKSVSLSFVDEEPPLVLHTVGLVSLPLFPSSN